MENSIICLYEPCGYINAENDNFSVFVFLATNKSFRDAVLVRFISNFFEELSSHSSMTDIITPQTNQVSLESDLTALYAILCWITLDSIFM